LKIFSGFQIKAFFLLYMKYFLPLVLISVFQSVTAQTFTPDPAFGNNGIVETSFASGTSRMRASAVLQNGSMITAGNTTNFTTDFVVTKVSSTGVLDNDFGNQGYASVDFSLGLEDLKSIAVQADGKILVAGTTKLNNNTSGAVSRLNANGSVDASFGTNGYLKFHATGTTTFTSIEKILILPDGKFLIGGYFLQGNVYRGFLQKYLSNGTLDSVFGTSGQVTINFAAASASSYIYDILLEADGKITLYGQNYATRFIVGIARLTSSGALDTGFSGDGVLTYSFTTIQNYTTRIFKLGDGKYVISGYANATGVNYKVYTARFGPTGILDNTYGTNGIGTHSANSSYTSGFGAVLLSDESLIITGEAYFDNIYHAVAYKVSPAGSLEIGFGTNGFARINSGTNSGFGNSVLASGGSIYITGAIYSSQANSNFGLVGGLESSGAVKPGFGTNGQVIFDKINASIQARHLDKTSTGQYIVSGDVPNFDTDQFNARFNTNGTLDLTYGSQGVSIQDFGSVDNYFDRVVMANGDMVQLSGVGSVSLAFTGLGTFTSTSDYGLVKTSGQGILAATSKKFRFSNTEFTSPKVIRRDVQGNIYVLADQTQPTRSSCFLSKHLSSSLELDNTFGTAGKYRFYSFSFPSDNFCRDFQVSADGSIYTITSTKNNLNLLGFRMRKYSTQMVRDQNFGTLFGELVVEEPPNSAFSALKLFINSNGFLLAGFKQGNRTIARISLTGQLQGYISLPEFKSIIKIATESDGSFYVSGMGQNDKFRLVKFFADGSPVTNFNGTGSLIDSYFTNAVSIEDFILEVGGGITILARTREGLGGEKLGLLRLIQVTSTDEKLATIYAANFIYPNPSSDHIFWQSNNFGEMETVSIMDATGKVVGPVSPTNGAAGINIRNLRTGKYWLSVQGSKERRLLPFLKQ